MASFTLLHYSLLLATTLLPLRSVNASIGVNYGRIADNLPPPEQALSIIQSMGINKVKIFDVEPLVINAFSNTNVELIVAIGDVNYMADPINALSWVETNIQPYLASTRITGVAVGNEILTFNDASLSTSLVIAMQNMYNALQSLGLEKQISVSSPHSIGILGSSYPPSSGAFKEEYIQYLAPILDFHAETNSPFFLNTYPYFAYKANSSYIPLDYVLLRPNQGFIDPATKLHYTDMLSAQISAVYTAMAALGHKEIEIHVTETGWPSKGDEDEAGATVDNAREYTSNLVNLVGSNKGTPLKPDLGLTVYFFALFNENMKPGPTSERNFGLFQPDGAPVYPLAFPRPFSSAKRTCSLSGLLLFFYFLLALLL